MSRGPEGTTGAPLAPGLVLGRYRLVRALGESRRRSVWEAVDLALKRPVILKMLAPGEGDLLASRQKFLDEARAAARLGHRGFAFVHDMGDAEGVTFFVMGFVADARPLRAFVADPETTIEARVALLRALAESLGALHASGHVHRGVSTDAVLVRPDGTPCVVDRGDARWMAPRPEPGERGRTTIEGDARAGPFLPPEARQGRFDARGDQYAWAVVASEVLGRADPGLAAVVAKARAVDPEARFGSMEDVVAAIDRRVGAPARSKPSAFIFPAVVVGVVLSGVALGLAWRRREGPPPSTLAGPRVRLVVPTVPTPSVTAAAPSARVEPSSAPPPPPPTKSRTYAVESLRVISPETAWRDASASILASRGYGFAQCIKASPPRCPVHVGITCAVDTDGNTYQCSGGPRDLDGRTLTCATFELSSCLAERVTSFRLPPAVWSEVRVEIVVR